MLKKKFGPIFKELLNLTSNKFKNKKSVNFVIFVAIKKDRTTNFSPFFLVAVFGSGMDKNQDPGSGTNIPDPQHCLSDVATHCTQYLYPICRKGIIKATVLFFSLTILD
jgi:hypothetical protein